jgi:D-cysteine desulfhydrase family pyridoxal phosphate-dependent enzyme
MKHPNDFPRIPLAILPTPVYRLDNVSHALGTNVYVKRDDLTGQGLGGNKVRKLEFLLAQAKEAGAEVVFTTGGAQSNHAMLTAACARKLGLTPILVLKKRGCTQRKGNLLLEELMGVAVHLVDTDSYDDIFAEMDRIGGELGKPYFKIPCGGSTPVGALGYVECAREISLGDIHFDHILCAEGSGGTHGGLALGARRYLPQTKVTGMMVDTDPFQEITLNLMKETADLLGWDDLNLGPEDLHLVDMSGPGYAIPSQEGDAAIRFLAEQEGLFLDPVYTGKAFAGLMKLAEQGAFRQEDNVLFLHTGGIGGLFALEQK